MKRKASSDNYKKNKSIKKQDDSQNEKKLMNEIVDLKNAVNINWKILNEYILSNLDK